MRQPNAHEGTASYVYVLAQDLPLHRLPSLDRIATVCFAFTLLGNSHRGYPPQIRSSPVTISAHFKLPPTDTPRDVIRRRVAWRRGQRTAPVELPHEAQHGNG